MEFIGGIEGMNFTPITDYNGYLKNTKSFEIDSDSDFQNILNKQAAVMQDSFKVQGGVEMNNFSDVVAQSSVQASSNSDSAGNFIKSFSNSINGGLTSVSDSIKAANRAQEAFATGENVSVHDVMIASEKASLSLQMAMQLRNKIISAYNEINNVKV